MRTSSLTIGPTSVLAACIQVRKLGVATAICEDEPIQANSRSNASSNVQRQVRKVPQGRFRTPSAYLIPDVTSITLLLDKPTFLSSSIESFSCPGRTVDGDWKTHPLASAVERFIVETVAMTTDPLALAGIEWSDDGATMGNRFVRYGLRNL